MLGGEAVGIHEVLRVRAQTQREPVDVARDRRRALRRQAAVDQIPGEVLLDQVHAEQVAQPREHLCGVGIRLGDAVHAVAERLPLQQLAVRARRLDQLSLVGIEDRGSFGRRRLRSGPQARRDVGDHLLDASREQLVLLFGAQAELDRAGRGAEVGDGLAEPAEPRAVEHPARSLLRGEGCQPSAGKPYRSSVHKAF